MEVNLQINRKNPDKAVILKELNKCKTDIMTVIMLPNLETANN